MRGRDNVEWIEYSLAMVNNKKTDETELLEPTAFCFNEQKGNTQQRRLQPSTMQITPNTKPAGCGES